MNRINTYLHEHRNRFENELCELVRIPSVSADPHARPELERAAGWLADQFRRLNMRVELVATAGNPLVVAESPAVQGAPTVLVYGHYDVQPPEPLELWETPPFEPSRRNGNLYGRGATDNKGQLLTHVKGAEAWLAVAGRLPVQLKFVIEGEEEVGSTNLERFLHEQAERLACDCVVISDGSQFGPGRPAITYGLRGIAYYELRLRGPNRDLHSGSFGGSITNPAIALAQMLAGLIDQDGRVTIPGFYDDVVRLSDEERKLLAGMPFDEAAYYRGVGVSQATGERGFSALERRWTRPSFDVNGLWSGYQGEGAKTVLPAEAGAKFSFRLVPNQDPARITAGLKQRLEALCPPGITMEVLDLHGAPAAVVSLKSPYVAAAARAIERAFGCPPLYTREGGSIPIVSTFAQTLNADVLLLGWGQDDDSAHSPNEKFSLTDYHRAIHASACLWGELGGTEMP